MPAGDVWGNAWLSAWGSSWRQATAAAVTPTVTGGHYWPKRRGRDIEPDDWRAKSAEERRAFLERLIAGANDAPAPVIEAAKAAVAAYESPKAPDDRVVIRRAALAKLARDIETVERLARIVREYQDDDDEALVLLLSG